MSSTSELPDISTRNSAKVYQKGHKSDFYSETLTPGNAKVAVLLVVPKILFLEHFPNFLPKKY